MIICPTQPVLRVRSAALCTIAQQAAARFLGRLGDRWRHTVGVARCAAELAEVLPLDGDVLVAAAWLHDIGYASVATATGFPPLDGARYLADQLWPMRVTGLVAHHSGARFVAADHGFGRAMTRFPDEAGPMSDALTYADQTVDATGLRVTVQERRADLLRRPRADPWNARMPRLRGPCLRAAVARVERRLARAGVAPPSSRDSTTR